MLGNSYFVPLCTCLQMTSKAPQVLILQGLRNRLSQVEEFTKMGSVNNEDHLSMSCQSFAVESK